MKALKGHDKFNALVVSWFSITRSGKMRKLRKRTFSRVKILHGVARQGRQSCEGGEGRISRRGAEHAEKAKTGEGEKPLRSMKSSQADTISNVCRATKGKSRRSNLVPLSFSACSAPLREILFVFAGGLTKRASPCREKPGPHEPSYPFAPGAMPTARLSSTLRLRPEGSSPKSALRGHVLGSLAECRSRNSSCQHPSIHLSR